MLSMINLLKDFNENKKKIYAYLRKLDKKNLYKIYINADQYEKDILYKNLSEETLISMITIILHRLTCNKDVLNVAPELKYKGKYPERHEKKISKIAKQLDSEAKY